MYPGLRDADLRAGEVRFREIRVAANRRRLIDEASDDRGSERGAERAAALPRLMGFGIHRLLGVRAKRLESRYRTALT